MFVFLFECFFVTASPQLGRIAESLVVIITMPNILLTMHDARQPTVTADGRQRDKGFEVHQRQPAPPYRYRFYF
jgi:hypothetical protein